MSRRAIHVCFYSKKCPHSKAFLEELARTPYTSEFQFICVDPAPNRPKLPSWLKAVPTLVIDGDVDPLTDEKVFNWLSLRRIQGGGGGGTPASRGGGDLPKPEISTRVPVQNSPPVYDPTVPQSTRMPEPMQTRPSPTQQSNQVVPPPATGDPDSYSLELSGSGKWSDAYSYIDDQFSIEKGVGTSRIERNFASLDGGPLPGAGGGGGGSRHQQQAIPEPQSEKAKALNSAYDNYMKQRNNDVPSAPARR